MQAFLGQALRVFCAATNVSGDVRNALFRHRNEPPAIFDDKTAEQLVSEQRTEDFLETVSKRLFCTPTGIPADQAATEFEERSMNVGTALETNA
ncbi:MULTISPECIES: hypothetical protein [Burkholderia cepacia complex]|uniref:hypothetical protein n=1 Tax=Burkholderia cepacia complex TaxID=87882 RepID=UPI0007C74B27|nr:MULTISPECIES: hypothetical protein [Burkholderia cepacia complex]